MLWRKRIININFLIIQDMIQKKMIFLMPYRYKNDGICCIRRTIAKQVIWVIKCSEKGSCKDSFWEHRSNFFDKTVQDLTINEISRIQSIEITTGRGGIKRRRRGISDYTWW